MYKKIKFLVVFAFLLAACSSQVTPEPTTVAPPEPTQAEPTAPPQEEPQPASAEAVVTIYKIVPGESQLQYEVGEVFLNQDNRFNVAVGITTQISGEISGNRENPRDISFSTFTADISQFTSDSDRRDNALRNRFLESASFPEVTFNITQMDGLPESYLEGEEVSLQITGDLTVHDVTKPVTFDAVVKFDGDTLSGEATTTILMSDFGFGPISIAGILNTEDEVKVTLNFVAKPSS
ncbi:MAG: YceI family protein [Anaerolineales bacterium]|nr:YceI family protein [Anaerolineales bacterium]